MQQLIFTIKHCVDNVKKKIKEAIKDWVATRNIDVEGILVTLTKFTLVQIKIIIQSLWLSDILREE